MTLPEAPELPPKLPSNSLLADSVARLVSAAIVDAMLEVLLAAALTGAVEAWLLVTLPIDIMASIATGGIKTIGRNSKNLRGLATPDLNKDRSFLGPSRH